MEGAGVAAGKATAGDLGAYICFELRREALCFVWR
jgi:hypothetical protein